MARGLLAKRACQEGSSRGLVQGLGSMVTTCRQAMALHESLSDSGSRGNSFRPMSRCMSRGGWRAWM